jgi:hypothetical protein
MPRRDVNGGERSDAVEHSKLTRIAAIRFEAIAGSAGNQRRGNDGAGNLARRQRALQFESHRPAS